MFKMTWTTLKAMLACTLMVCRRASREEGDTSPALNKKKCLWTGHLPRKMPHEGPKWPRMSCFRIHSPCLALILDAPLGNKFHKTVIRYTIISTYICIFKDYLTKRIEASCLSVKWWLWDKTQSWLGKIWI